MGYHLIDPFDIEPTPDRPSKTHWISKAAELKHLGLRVYDVAPGEDIPLSGLHYHDQQEEVFYVLEGELAVETPETDYVVAPGEFFIAEPGSPHRAYNATDADGNAVVIAMGAPSVDDGHNYERE